MIEKITQVQEEALSEIEKADSVESLQQLRITYLGKKGKIQELMSLMRDLSKEEKPAFGQKVKQSNFKYSEMLAILKELQATDEEILKFMRL